MPQDTPPFLATPFHKLCLSSVKTGSWPGALKIALFAGQKYILLNYNLPSDHRKAQGVFLRGYRSQGLKTAL